MADRQTYTYLEEEGQVNGINTRRTRETSIFTPSPLTIGVSLLLGALAIFCILEFGFPYRAPYPMMIEDIEFDKAGCHMTLDTGTSYATINVPGEFASKYKVGQMVHFEAKIGRITGR